MSVNQATLSGWDIVIVVIYFLIVIGIGIFATYRSKRGSVSGYFLAGRYMTWLPVGASLFASNVGTAHFIGLTGSGAAAGLGIGIYELAAIITLQALGWIFLPVYIASGAKTLPEYMGKRFGGERIRMYLAVLALVMYIFINLTVDLFSGAVFMTTFFGWNMYAGILLVLAMTVITTVAGGLTAVMYTETLQCCMVVLGGLFVSVYSYVAVGGFEGVMRGYWGAIANETAVARTGCGIPSPNSFRMIGGISDPQFPWLGVIFGLMSLSIWCWASDQLQVQRTLAAKDISHAQGGTILAGYLKFLPMFFMVIPGMISRILYPDEVACVSTCEQVCGSQYGCSNIAFPKLVLNLIPAGFRGLMFAVMVAALMGNISAIFNSASTLFTMDIYSKIRKKASSMELLIVGRIFIGIMVLFAILWMPVIERYQNGQVFLYIQSIYAYLAPSIATAFMFAVLWPRCNEKGVFCGLVVGFLIGIIRMILEFSYPAPPCGQPDLRPVVITQFHFLYFATMLELLTALIIVVISLCTAPPDPKQLIRTTFWSRKDQDGLDDDTELRHFAQPIAESETISTTDSVTVLPIAEGPEPSKSRAILNSACSWICGYNSQSQRDKANMENHLRHLRSLEQPRWKVVILLTNTVILLLLTIGLIIFFSVGTPIIAESYKPSWYHPGKG